jgi:hypothetical protein
MTDISKPQGAPLEDIHGEIHVPSTPQPAIRGRQARVASVPALLTGNPSVNPDRSKTATQSQTTKDWTRGP